MTFFKKFFYFIFIVIFTITLFLTLFELLLHIFHKPITFPIEDRITHSETWAYLLKQQYISFIDLDIYNISEKRHLLDVKRVLESTYNVWLILLGISFIGLTIFRKTYKVFIQQTAILGLIVSALLIVSSINFISVFEFMHSLFFNAKTWIFPKESMLIELFPLVYFQQFFFLFLIGSIILFTTLSRNK
ncbi:MAG TPA: DUF1461 domain-containing protein [Arcobacter sp.]|nr:DUF1461 domain-containing protein [Arcobacter sp.]